MAALEEHKALLPHLRELRWELALYGRLSHARYGAQWHPDTAFHVASQAGWALAHLARLDFAQPLQPEPAPRLHSSRK